MFNFAGTLHTKESALEAITKLSANGREMDILRDDQKLLFETVRILTGKTEAEMQSALWQAVDNLVNPKLRP